MILAELEPGEVGVIQKITAQGILAQRLLDLGLVPKTKVEALFTSRGGDPVAYFVRGTVLALRLSTAREVIITSCGR